LQAGGQRFDPAWLHQKQCLMDVAFLEAIQEGIRPENNFAP
jgi:hypothetical protein